MDLSKEKLLEVYRHMYQTRVFEQECEKLNKNKEILGSIHGSMGEEATSVGLAALLRPDDVLSPSYRDPGALFMKGLTTMDLVGMLFAKDCGKTKGRTRVLHVGDFRKNIYPPNPILGASSVIANGAALAFKMNGSDRIVLNIMGDGASNEGAVHEAMNFAAVKNLPIIFAIENNAYAWSTPFKNNFRIHTFIERAIGYGIPGFIADGYDVMDVMQVMEEAIEHVRSGRGPALVECRTYRWSGHSGNDKNVYRPWEEIVRWKQNCPIARFGGYLTNAAISSDEELAAIRTEVEQEVQDAIEYSKTAPYPDCGEFFRDDVMLAAE
ncbi:MAG: thiamine pyrophosphate-dependent dehydrogenase E1 component subunit alpha [Lachnospiraceae bacterium]|nr:thiamine pyrophosphate-dependent dehydrogenase E1 component subunit alpha [Lachnospiraceae bacterium]